MAGPCARPFSFPVSFLANAAPHTAKQLDSPRYFEAFRRHVAVPLTRMMNFRHRVKKAFDALSN
jgi:hypothetical protein